MTGPVIDAVRFTGGDVVVGDHLERLDVIAADGRITALEPTADRAATAAHPIWVGELGDAPEDPTQIAGNVDGVAVVDCRGAVIAPGFIDLQCNGAGGVDITTAPERIADVGRQLTRFGVTAYLPTVVTAPPDTRHRAIEAMTELAARPRAPGDGAMALGLHFEGPAISPDHVGAHPRRLVTVPHDDELDVWVASGVVRLVTLAPEVPGGTAMAARLATGGVVVAAGHTAMTPAEWAAAKAAGARYVTHLYNAMRPFSHRAPGPIGAVLADDDAIVGLICDGVHVDPVAVKLAWRALGPTRTSLVSDAAPPLGGAHGTYELGGFAVHYDETGVRTDEGVLAGSALELDQAVRNLVAYTDCSLVDAVATVTSTPADLLGLEGRGRITVGGRADLTILDPEGGLIATVIAGSTEWARPGWTGAEGHPIGGSAWRP